MGRICTHADPAQHPTTAGQDPDDPDQDLSYLYRDLSYLHRDLSDLDRDLSDLSPATLVQCQIGSFCFTLVPDAARS